MPATLTPFAGLVKQQPLGAETNNVWGEVLNSNYDVLDNFLAQAGNLPLTSPATQLVGLTIRQSVEYLLTLNGGAGTIPAMNVTFDTVGTDIASGNVQDALSEIDSRVITYNEEEFTATADGVQTFTLSNPADVILYASVGGVNQPQSLIVFTYPSVQLLQPAIKSGMRVVIGFAKGGV